MTNFTAQCDSIPRARFEPDPIAPEIGVVDALIKTICFRDAQSPVDIAADDQVRSFAQTGEMLPYYTRFAAQSAEILKRDFRLSHSCCRCIPGHLRSVFL